MNLNDLTIPTSFSPRALLGIYIAAAGILFITFVYAIWQWHSDWVLAHQNIQESHASATSLSTSDILASIKEGNLFGKSVAKLGDMPITNLQLRVTGIVKGASTSKAYISIDGQPGKIYQTGEELPYGVKVYEITPNAVVLENDGHLEKLPLPRERLKFKPRTEERSP